MNEQEIVDQFVEVVTNNVGAISSTRLNSQVLLTFSFAIVVDFKRQRVHTLRVICFGTDMDEQVYTFAEIFG